MPRLLAPGVGSNPSRNFQDKNCFKKGRRVPELSNSVASGFRKRILTRRGEALAALVSVEDLKFLQEMEDRMDIGDARQARESREETVSWEC